MIHNVTVSELYPYDVPFVEPFEEYLGSLGIANTHHIIIYDRSEHGFNFSARMWSLLRVSLCVVLFCFEFLLNK